MSDHTSILSRQEREWVELWLRGELDICGNERQVLRVMERMWVELEGWHKMAWLWADMRVSGEPVQLSLEVR